MNLLRLLGVLFFVILLSSCTEETPLEPIITPLIPTDTLIMGQRKVVNSILTVDNNCWADASTQTLIEQNLYLYDETDSTLCGWKWDWNGCSADEVLGFPNIFFGKDPWTSTESLSPELPCRLDLINNVSVSFNLSDKSEGANCTSISSWLVEKSGDAFQIRDEILIRLNRDSIANIGELLSDAVVVDGLKASVYKRSAPVNDTTYFSFTVTLHEEYLIGEINLKKWIYELIGLGFITNENQSKYLSQIQLGTEMVNGSGTVLVKEFSVDCDVEYEPVEIRLDSTMQFKESYIFHNNCWGSEEFENSITQNFYHYPESDTLCSWHWDWKDEGDGTILSYPNVHLGKDMWLVHDYELSPFPGLLNTITDFSVDFEILSTSTGASATSIAYWFSDEGTTTDLVIFRLNNNTLPPLGTLTASDVTINNHTGTIYTGFVDEGAIAYNTTVVEFPVDILSGTFNLKTWTDHFIASGYITNTKGTKMIDQILLGTETAGGSGDVYVKKFDVTCNLQTVQPSYIEYSPDNHTHEQFLNKFDALGIDVILGVEPGFAQCDSLMNIVMKRFKHHPSVIGYGVDVEWRTYKEDEANYGRKVSDEEAEALDQQLKSLYGNPNYRLVFKHWDSKWMPPTYRGTNNDIIFINDGQNFGTQKTQVDYFTDWCNTFSNNDVLFQIGYESDHPWWKDMENPIKIIGDAIAAQKSTTQKAGMLWVDFSANYPEVSLLKYSKSQASKGTPLTAADFQFPGECDVAMAGLRITSYGPLYNSKPYDFPTVESDQWGYAIRNVQKQFPGSRPVVLWAVGHIRGNTCVLEFPQD